jgi:hypothetical protein
MLKLSQNVFVKRSIILWRKKMESIWNILEQSIFDMESWPLNNFSTLKCWTSHGTITIDVFWCSNVLARHYHDAWDQVPILTNTIQIVKKYNNYNKNSKSDFGSFRSPKVRKKKKLLNSYTSLWRKNIERWLKICTLFLIIARFG